MAVELEFLWGQPDRLLFLVQLERLGWIGSWLSNCDRSLDL
jgi:hypothetical protein